VPLRGGDPVIRNVVGFGGGSASSCRRLAEWCGVPWGKKGKQGRRERDSGNGTSLPAAFVSPLPHPPVRTIPRTQ